MQATAARTMAPMRRSLQERLTDLDGRIRILTDRRSGDDGIEITALLMLLTRERGDITEAIRDAILIDDDPFDTEAIEIGDTVTICDLQGNKDRYVLVDGKVRSRARSNRVSASSPLGTAILGRSKQDRVEVDSPRGPRSYLILDFERASEDSLALTKSAQPNYPSRPRKGRRLERGRMVLP